MTDWTPSRPRPSLPRRAAGLLQRSTQLLVWLAAVFALLWLHSMPLMSGPLPGIAASAEASVVTPIAGRLTAVLVTLHQEVEANQVVGELQAGTTDREPVLLRAPMRGRIAQLPVHLGQWLGSGQTVAGIVDPTPHHIVAYAPEALGSALAATQSVRILRLDHSLLGMATIQSVSPSVVRLPERLWRDPRQEEWGYEVMITATSKERIGERVQVLPQP